MKICKGRERGGGGRSRGHGNWYLCFLNFQLAILRIYWLYVFCSDDGWLEWLLYFPCSGAVNDMTLYNARLWIISIHVVRVSVQATSEGSQIEIEVSRHAKWGSTPLPRLLSIEFLNTFLVNPWTCRLCNSPSACSDHSIPPTMPAVRTTQSWIQVLRSSSPAPPYQILAPHAPPLLHPALYSCAHNHD